MQEISKETLDNIQSSTLEYLQSTFEPAQTVYVIIERVSSSGMSRDMSFFVVHNGELQRVTALVQALTGYRWNKRHEAITVKGCGMDMAWATVHEACQALGIPTKRHHVL